MANVKIASTASTITRRTIQNLWVPRDSILVACILLLLGLIMPVNGALAATLNELHAKLDEVEALLAEGHRLAEQEGEVVREMYTTTDRALEHRLRNQHQEILREITRLDESRLHVLNEAANLLSGYEPASRRDWEAAIRETQRLVEFLRRERHMILSDGQPAELVSERGIDKLLEVAVDHSRVLYDKEQKFIPKKSQYPSVKETEKKVEKEGLEKDEPPAHRIQQESFFTWFDRQEPAVKTALIAAIVSIIGTLATVVVAAIRRRN